MWELTDSDREFLHQSNDAWQAERQLASRPGCWGCIVADQAARPGVFQRLRRRAAAGLGALALAAGVFGVAVADELPDYVVPAANAAGFEGWWSSNLQVLCKGLEPCSYHLEAVANGQSSPVATGPSRMLSSGQGEHLMNVVGDYLHLEPFSGALRVYVEEGDMAFNSSTLHTFPDGSVVGQGVAPLPLDDPILAGQEAFLFAEPDISTDEEQGFRHNAYFYALTEGQVLYSIVNTQGFLLADGAIELAAGQTLQQNRFLREHGITPAMDALGVILQGTMPYVAGMSVTDERGAQDPTWYLASREPILSAGMVVADGPGANGSYWKTSVKIWNPGDQPTNARLELHPSEGEPFPPYFINSIPARGGVSIENIMDEEHLNAIGLQGFLDLASCRNLFVQGRVYADSGEGGTAGQGMPPMEQGEGCGPWTNAHVFGLEEHASARTNVGVFNSSNGRVGVKLYALDGDTGQVLKEIDRVLEGKEWVQFNRIFRDVYEGVNGVVRGSFLGGGWIYASTIQNEPLLPPEERHNDPRLQVQAVGPFIQPTLEVVIDGDRELDPIIGEGTLYVYAKEPRLAGDIYRLEIDMNGDGDLDDTMDVIKTYEHKDAIKEEIPSLYDGNFSGDTVTRTIKVYSRYDPHNPQNDQRTRTHTVDVKRVSELERDWLTRADASADANSRILSALDDFVYALSNGPGAATPEQARDFLEFTTNCSDARYYVNDSNNNFSATACGAQGSLGSSFEATFDQIVIEGLAPDLEYNP